MPALAMLPTFQPLDALLVPEQVMTVPTGNNIRNVFSLLSKIYTRTKKD